MPTRRTPSGVLGWLVLFAIFVPGCQSQDRAAGSVDYPGTRVWRGEGPDFYTGDVSPDGRYFTDINWDTGDVDVVDLETGQAKPLTGHGYDVDRNAWRSAFSSDGRTVAVEWFNYATDSHELRLESLNGRASRLLVPPTTGFYYVEPLDWSPSDTQILVALKQTGDDWKLGVVTTADGSIRVLKSLGREAPGGFHPQSYPYAAWSPDGKWIAYDYTSPTDANGHDVFLLATDGNVQRALAAGPGADRVAAWSPDGSTLMFYSDRSGVPALWKLPIADGQAAGEPVLVASDIRGIKPLGWTREGFVYGVADGTANTHVARIDAESGQVLEEPHAVDDTPWHRNAVGDWSPDGSHLMYVTFEPLPDSREYAVFASPSGAVSRRVPFPRTFHGETGKISWLSDDTFLVDGTLDDLSGLVRLRADDGTVTALGDYGGQGLFNIVEVSADGSEFYLVINQPAPRVMAIDIKSGARRTLIEVPVNPVTMSVSPDGRELAYLTRPDAEGRVSIQAVNTQGGVPREVLRRSAARLRPPLAWAADGTSILVGVRLEDGRSGLWSVAADGSGKTVFIDLPSITGTWIRVSPAGGWIAFQSGTSTGSIRLMDVHD